MKNNTEAYASDLFAFMPETGVVHMVMPNMATACGVEYLTMRDQGDSSRFGPPARWSDVSCPWCRSLGRVAIDHARALMQGHPAPTI